MRPCIPATGLLTFLVTFFSFSIVPTVYADDDICAHSLSAYPFESPLRGMPSTTDTLRALIVFAKHTDAENGLNCGSFGDNWTDSSEIPPWADDFVEDTDTPGSFTPVKPGSLTHYFWTMSGEKHLLLGQVYPDVVVPDSTIQQIDNNSAYNGWEYAHSNRMVLQEIDPSFSFADFDMNGDDEVDFVFIYYWSPKSSAGDYRINRYGSDTWVGISLLLPSNLGLDGGALTATIGGGATVVPRAFNAADSECIGGNGVARVRNQWWFLATSLHEYFHDIFVSSWPDLGGWPGHIESAGAYDMMEGQHTGMLLSAASRYKAGWLSPPQLTPGVFSGDTTIVLRNVAKYNDRSSIILRTSDADQYFVVEARDTTGSVYTSTMPVVSGLASCCRFPGITPGLLVTHIHEEGKRGWSTLPPKPPIFDPELALI